MAENFLIPTYFMLILVVSRLIFALGKSKPWISSIVLPSVVLTNEEIGYKLRDDPDAIKMGSTDYGHMVREIPAAVLGPSSVNDIASLIKSSNNLSVPFTIAARGQGHSTQGQAMAQNGVVVNMTALRHHRNDGSGIFVSGNPSLGYYYADVGGEQLWVDVLHATLTRGLAPVSWTDYLHLTVGGTLSNAGISGQSFRYGPQISNVYELDVITGKGEFVTCSPHMNSELFYAVLGGLGQFGIIVRARIALEPAPKRVKWVRMLYTDFSAFSRDQERLIKINGRKEKNALDYLEGSLLLNQGPPDNWRASSFFPPSDHSRIISKVTEHKIVYCLEVAKYYDDRSSKTVHKVIEALLKGLSFEPGFMFEKDVSYVDFLDRVRSGELKLQSQGLWEVPHPWLNLFVPNTQVSDFNRVFKEIVLKRNITTGPVLLYPMNRSKWDDRMSAVIPDEDVFYAVGFLHSSGFDDWESFDEQNKEILKFCEDAGINAKQYLPHYITQEGWMKHFGSKWRTFNERKAMFDPKKILSPGQKIFSHH